MEMAENREWRDRGGKENCIENSVFAGSVSCARNVALSQGEK